MDSPTKIVSELSAGVFRLAYRIVGDRDQALDISQEVFVKVLCESSRKVNENKLRAYIMKSAYNTALNYRRDSSRRKAILRDYEQCPRDSYNARPDVNLQREETVHHIYRAIETLPEKQREALCLRFLGNLTIAEIGRVMSVADGSVKVHLARGLNKLRSLLREVAGKEKL